jgi:hypothetical protein
MVGIRLPITRVQGKVKLSRSNVTLGGARILSLGLYTVI